ncbi:MAG: chorismate synthase [Bacteroidales bacterium]|nr:chorismate synthase [Bacteroidales bacterium]
MNTFGKLFTLTTYGESHGVAVGGIIDGMPAGIEVDEAFLQAEMARRKPGQSAITTDRKEEDHVELLSGIFEGKTTGTPIGFEVRNSNQHSQDYENIRNLYRPSHADFTYTQKYGLRDHRGGGRSSARETLSRVVGGAFAKMALRTQGIQVQAFTSQVGNLVLPGFYTDYDLAEAEQNAVRCPDPTLAAQMEQLIKEVKAEGDTIGGVVTCVIKNVPVGLGEPCFDKLHAALGQAMLSINACKGFDYGLGFADCGRRGSEMIDTFVREGNKITTLSNHSGGIQGGISNGQDIYFRCAFKPVATLLQEVETVTLDGEATTLKARGRHDPCVLPRAVPVVEAMAAMVVLDFLLMNNARL